MKDKKSKHEAHESQERDEANDVTVPQQEQASPQEQIEALKKENEELLQKLQRLSADYANFQKRSVRQIAESVNYEKDAIIKSLLPALDNFDHALANASSAPDANTLLKGIEIIYDHMLEILKSHGVEPVSSVGERFDPSMHQAMMQRSEGDKEDGIVLEEFQKGYTLNGRVLRPAKVVVNKLERRPIDEALDIDETTDIED